MIQMGWKEWKKVNSIWGVRFLLTPDGDNLVRRCIWNAGGAQERQTLETVI
jgi:hypothetical protein